MVKLLNWDLIRKKNFHLLKESFLNLQDYAESLNYKLSVTWKVHILLCHVLPFCLSVDCGLARFAEQTGEAIHAKFKPTWQCYKVKPDKANHGEKLCSAVSVFSAVRK